jgi:hypothetical protein
MKRRNLSMSMYLLAALVIFLTLFAMGKNQSSDVLNDQPTKEERAAKMRHEREEAAHSFLIHESRK